MSPGLEFSISGTHFSRYTVSLWASHHQPKGRVSLGKKNGEGIQKLTLMHLGDDRKHLVFPSEIGNLYLAHGGWKRREIEGSN